MNNWKRIWSYLFKNYKDIIILSIGFIIGLSVIIFFWYIIMLVIGFVIGYSINKFLMLRKKQENQNEPKK